MSVISLPCSARQCNLAGQVGQCRQGGVGGGGGGGVGGGGGGMVWLKGAQKKGCQHVSFT